MRKTEFCTRKMEFHVGVHAFDTKEELETFLTNARGSSKNWDRRPARSNHSRANSSQTTG